jgi:hypothetical protein
MRGLHKDNAGRIDPSHDDWRCRHEYLPYFRHARHPDAAVPLLHRAGLTFRAPMSEYGERDPH